MNAQLVQAEPLLTPELGGRQAVELCQGFQDRSFRVGVGTRGVDELTKRLVRQTFDQFFRQRPRERRDKLGDHLVLERRDRDATDQAADQAPDALLRGRPPEGDQSAQQVAVIDRVSGKPPRVLIAPGQSLLAGCGSGMNVLTMSYWITPVLKQVNLCWRSL